MATAAGELGFTCIRCLERFDTPAGNPCAFSFQAVRGRATCGDVVCCTRQRDTPAGARGCGTCVALDSVGEAPLCTACASLPPMRCLACKVPLNEADQWIVFSESVSQLVVDDTSEPQPDPARTGFYHDDCLPFVCVRCGICGTADQSAGFVESRSNDRHLCTWCASSGDASDD